MTPHVNSRLYVTLKSQNNNEDWSLKVIIRVLKAKVSWKYWSALLVYILTILGHLMGCHFATFIVSLYMCPYSFLHGILLNDCHSRLMPKIQYLSYIHFHVYTIYLLLLLWSWYPCKWINNLGRGTYDHFSKSLWLYLGVRRDELIFMCGEIENTFIGVSSNASLIVFILVKVSNEKVSPYFLLIFKVMVNNRYTCTISPQFEQMNKYKVSILFYNKYQYTWTKHSWLW